MPIELTETKNENPFHQQLNATKQNLSNVKNIIAVHSGKGGVGKSTFAVNFAFTLKKSGFKCGVLDADVDCPSCGKLFGVNERVMANREGRLMPLESKGVKFLSVSNMVDSEEKANVMRGPIMFKLISEMLQKGEWGELDFLIIDLPPGTGDNPLTILQIAPLTGLIVVTQPQEVALVDARKSIDMARRMSVMVIGIVENMSGEVFGEGGGEKIAKNLEIPFLGKISLNKKIREFSEKGKPAIENKATFEEFNEIVSNSGLVH